MASLIETVKNEVETESSNTAEDCFSCRIIGSTALIVASAYVFTRGIKARLLSTQIISTMFGSSLGYTGMARFMDWYPFNQHQKLIEDIPNNSSKDL